MAALSTTQLKLRTTPTAGVASEQSPYYRRLLSAGYKGFLQGTVGGSTLYGLIGGVIGGLVALPLLPMIGIGALALIPAMGGLGLYKGAATFGNIGSLAAITAESAEMSEKRRYLLDRYYDLPDTPEFDGEAQQIREMLAKQHESKPPQHMFHWRTVFVGALLGAGVSLLFLTTPIAAAFVGGHFIFGSAATAIGVGIGTALGALSGGMIGLDRYYVRGWLDKSASMMHDSKTIEDQISEREREIQQLGNSSNDIKRASVTDIKHYLPPAPLRDDEVQRIEVAEPAGAPHPARPHQRDVEESHPAGARRAAPIEPRVIAGLEDTPASTVAAGQAQHHDRVVPLDEALRNPVL